MSGPVGTPTYDEVLTKHIGQFGPGQWLSLLWASTSEIANAAAFFVWVFITIDPVANLSWQCTEAADTGCAVVWQQDSLTSNSHSFCSLQRNQWHWTRQGSLVTKFDLVCSGAWKVQFANSLMFMGAFLGSGVFGFLCDSWGRRKPLFLATAIVAASMLASLAAPSYWVMAMLRAVTGFGAAGQTHTIALLSTEPVGPNFRGMAAIIGALIFTVGEFLLVALAFALPAWKDLMLAAGCINAAALLLYPLVAESGRWLLSQGRTDEAVSILQKTAKHNKSAMPPDLFVSSSNNFDLQGVSCKDVAIEAGLPCGTAHCRNDCCRPAPPAATAGLLQVLRQRQLAFRLGVLLLNWFAMYLSYYGITVSSGSITGSTYTTYAIGVASEVVALLIVGSTVDRLGRRNIVAFGQLLGGSACLACAMVNGHIAQAVLAGIGKLGSSAAKSIIGLYTAELLPTTCRSSITGICRQVSRLGSISAPFMLMFGSQLGSVCGFSQVFVTFTVFGCLAILAGILTLLLPETCGAEMPETIEDLNKLQSVFAAKPWRQGWVALLRFVFSTKATAAT